MTLRDDIYKKLLSIFGGNKFYLCMLAADDIINLLEESGYDVYNPPFNEDDPFYVDPDPPKFFKQEENVISIKRNKNHRVIEKDIGNGFIQTETWRVDDYGYTELICEEE